MDSRYLIAAFMLSTPVLLQAGEIASYAVTQESMGPDAGQKSVTNWYVTPVKSRTEMSPAAANPLRGMVVITRRDKGLVWTLFPTRKTYIERALEEDQLRELGERYKADLRVENLGREEVLGYGCDKQRVGSEVRIGSRTVKSVQMVWKCDGFDIPLRIDGEDGSRTRTTGLQVGPQSDALFEVPRGYRKGESLMDAMGVGNGR